MDIFKNTWFVGIATGIISGILVFFFFFWIAKKKGREDYYKQVMMANQSVITALKPYIAERGLPELEIFSSLIASTARMYSVEEKDMFTISVFCEELIREIISDIYVSTDKKKEYTDSLIVYKKEIDKENLENKVQVVSNNVEFNKKYRKSISMYMAFLASILTGTLTLLLTISDIIDINENHSFWDPFESNPLLWLPVLIVLITVIWLIIDYLFRRIFKKRNKLNSSCVEEIAESQIEGNMKDQNSEFEKKE